MSKNKCSFHSLKFVLLFYKLKRPGLTWTTLVYYRKTLLEMLHQYLPKDVMQVCWWCTVQHFLQHTQLKTARTVFKKSNAFTALLFVKCNLYWYSKSNPDFTSMTCSTFCYMFYTMTIGIKPSYLISYLAIYLPTYLSIYMPTWTIDQSFCLTLCLLRTHSATLPLTVYLPTTTIGYHML